MVTKRCVFGISRCVSLSVLFGIALAVSAQHHVFLQGGWHEGFEITHDPNSVVASNSNISTLINPGYQYIRGYSALDVGYRYTRFLRGTGHWAKADHPRGGFQVNVVEHLHDLTFGCTRYLWLQQQKLFNIGFRLGASITYVPYNKWDMNSAAHVSELDTTQTYWDSDGNVKFYSKEYERFLTDINLSLDASVEFRLRVLDRFSVSLIPQYSKGFLELYRADIWYYDFLNGLSGHAIVKSYGSYFGVFGRLTYTMNVYQP